MALEDAINEIPEHMRSGITEYIAKGQPPGGFVTALLKSPHSVLHEPRMPEAAAMRADPINAQAWEQWRAVLWHIPALAWGGPDFVRHWIRCGGMMERAA
jgi:hypothetical protein